jgi:hypothetical protein
MRQPFQLDPPEVLSEPQRGKIKQIVYLDDMERFQFGEASEETEVDRLAEAEEQRPQMHER